MRCICLKVSRKENQETQDTSMVTGLDDILPGYGQFQESTYSRHMERGWSYDVYFVEKLPRRSFSSENQTPLSAKPTYLLFPSHTQVSDLGNILGFALVDKYTQ